jgi:transposase-like protein
MANINCKDCNSDEVTKNGKVRCKQRYLCKKCGLNFVLGDERTNENIVALKALVVLLYALAKGSYNVLGTIFGRDRSLIYRWIKEAGLTFDDSKVEGEIKEIEFDEMWHFIGSKKTNFGSSKPLIAARGKLSPGFSVVVMLQHSEDCITSSSI